MLTPILEVAGDGPPPSAPDDFAVALEDGAVLVFPDLGFPLLPAERAFTERPFASGKTKNVSLRGAAGELRGAIGTPAERQALAVMLVRYRAFSQDLLRRILPGYGGHLDFAKTSYRPFEVEDRPSSWRADDRRLHVDAFPSNPVGQTRILRVFHNLNAEGQPRVWRVGEDFSAMAERFLPRVPRYSPMTARLLALAGLTKSRRTEYDHVMLHLHDGLKRDGDYQAHGPQRRADFAAGSTWVTFSDLVLHAAMSGRYMLEQTIRLPVTAQRDPEKSPQRILARRLGHALH